MKNLMISLASLLAVQITQAQRLIYISNVDQSSAGSHAVGSDSWLATGFYTGNNVGGYTLNSVNLEMANANGNPNGFTVMIYSAIGLGNYFPESNIETLTGSLNPLTSGIYDYTPASSLVLSPDTAYFIVMTSDTGISDGAFESSYASTYNLTGGWRAPLGSLAVDNFQSSDGLNWNYLGGYPQYAITATAVPEPLPSWLSLLGSGAFLYVRRMFHR